jgi:hypothetical protein
MKMKIRAAVRYRSGSRGDGAVDSSIRAEILLYNYTIDFVESFFRATRSVPNLQISFYSIYFAKPWPTTALIRPWWWTPE